MVNFNNETTVSTPAHDIVRILILQARANVFEAFELYKKKFHNLQEAPHEKGILIARLSAWFLEHQSYLKRIAYASPKNKDEQGEYNKMVQDLLIKGTELSYERIVEIIMFLNDTLDQLKLTRVDTKNVYDRTNWEEDNKQHGYS